VVGTWHCREKAAESSPTTGEQGPYLVKIKGSGWRDLNPRPLRPERSALAKLRYTPINMQQWYPRNIFQSSRESFYRSITFHIAAKELRQNLRQEWRYLRLSRINRACLIPQICNGGPVFGHIGYDSPGFCEVLSEDDLPLLS
jgi:hypothetical protein